MITRTFFSISSHLRTIFYGLQSMTSMAALHLVSRQLDISLTAHELFSFFSHLPWAILLDSANANHEDAKYDIICINPIATLTELNLIGDKSNILLTDNITNKKINQLTDPFDAINNLLNKYYPNMNNIDEKNSLCHHSLPFYGGAMGCFSYDLGRKIECMPEMAAIDINLPPVNLGFYDWALIFDYQDKCWYLTHCRGSEALKSVHLWINETINSPHSKQNTQQNFQLIGDWQHQLTKQSYQEKFHKIQHYLVSGDCYQVNLTQRFQASYQGDEWQAYLALSDANKAPFSAFIRLPKQTILSISPERFIKLKQNNIETKPIKGTLPRHRDPILDKNAAIQLQHSEKDRAENLMIVDLLRNDIGKVAQTGTVKVPKLFAVESFPAVHHLVSTITAKLKQDLHATDLLKASFPGGSITGAPKIRAMQIIEELEPSRRSLYCGAIGYISCHGNMDTNITIRTLLTENNNIYCWAGGGIVADSQCEAEYQETFDKVSKILPLLRELNHH